MINKCEIIQPEREKLPPHGQEFWVLDYCGGDIFACRHNATEDSMWCWKTVLTFGWHDNEEDATAYWKSVLNKHIASYTEDVEEYYEDIETDDYRY